MKKTLLNVLKYSLGVGLGAICLYFAFGNADWDTLWQAILEVKIGWIVFSAFVGVSSHFVRALRWRMQLKASGYGPTVMNVFASLMTAYMVNQALPRAGEIARCSMLYRSDRIPLTQSLGTVVIERVFDLIILIGLISLAFVLEYETISGFLNRVFGGSEAGGVPIWLWVLGSLGVVGGGLSWIFRHQLMKLSIVRRILGFIRELIRGALSIRHIERPWLFILYTLFIWICYWMMTYFAFYGIEGFVEVKYNWLYLSLITTVIGGIGIALPAPGGTGPYHFAVIFTFTTLLVTGEQASSETLGQTFALIMHSSQMVMMLVIGLMGYLYLWLRPAVDSKLPTADQEPSTVAPK